MNATSERIAAMDHEAAKPAKSSKYTFFEVTTALVMGFRMPDLSDPWDHFDSALNDRFAEVAADERSNAADRIRSLGIDWMRDSEPAEHIAEACIRAVLHATGCLWGGGEHDWETYNVPEGPETMCHKCGMTRKT